MGDALVVQPDRRFDRLRREQARALFVRLMDRRERGSQGTVGLEDAPARQPQLQSRSNVGNRGDVVLAQDFFPKIRVAQVRCGDVTDGLTVLDFNDDLPVVFGPCFGSGDRQPNPQTQGKGPTHGFRCQHKRPHGVPNLLVTRAIFLHVASRSLETPGTSASCSRWPKPSMERSRRPKPISRPVPSSCTTRLSDRDRGPVVVLGARRGRTSSGRKSLSGASFRLTFRLEMVPDLFPGQVSPEGTVPLWIFHPNAPGDKPRSLARRRACRAAGQQVGRSGLLPPTRRQRA